MATSSSGCVCRCNFARASKTQEGLVSIRINSAFADGAMIAGIVAGFVFGNLLSPAADADAAGIPNFAPDPSISWSLEGRLDDLLPPTSGPSPVTFDPAHPFNPGINYRV